jgi:uncharacterized protein (DUF952 family)
MTRIFHLTPAAAWVDAQRAGVYTADSLASEGFIHCSTAEQVVWVANNRFRGRTEYVLLHIDRDRLSAPVKYENLEGGRQLFPHIYGPLNLDAVIDVTPFPPDEAGTFDHHAARLERTTLSQLPENGRSGTE